MKLRTLSFWLLFSLSGCQETPVYKASVVEVPVAMPCKAAIPAKPKWPTVMVKPDADILAQTRATLAELELRRGYEGQLLAALKGCTGK